jgi:hypothetical protein
MAEPGTFEFLLDQTNQNSKEIGVIYKQEIMEMPIPQFKEFMGRMVNVKRRVRYDHIIYQPVNILQNHFQSAFRNGRDQSDYYATDKTEAGKYAKNEWYTNMSRGGAFQKSDSVIIHAIEAPVTFTGGRPTTVSAGIITDPTATFVGANYDPCLLQHAWGKNFRLEFMMGDDSKIKGRLDDFPMLSGGQTAALGATAGGVSQNGHFSTNHLTRPRVIEGDEDFRILVTPLSPVGLDLTNYGRQYAQEIRMHTVEVVQNRP